MYITYDAVLVNLAGLRLGATASRRVSFFVWHDLWLFVLRKHPKLGSQIHRCGFEFFLLLVLLLFVVSEAQRLQVRLESISAHIWQANPIACRKSQRFQSRPGLAQIEMRSIGPRNSIG
jgi:hypothetical protein